MPPKKIPPKTSQQKPPAQNVSKDKSKHTPTTADYGPAIPEAEVKKSSSVSAQLALEAAKKAYELRQAAYGIADPNAREEVLAKAINKEIEAESFGKAAKYTRSGAFQGLAAGAGLGVQPGVTLGKLTGALVGGLVSSVGAVLGGGIGSAYGAMNGPFWDLGQIASQGVRSIIGDFPNWEATSSQKAALEKMVMGAQQTKAPNEEELEEMRRDDGGASQADYQEFTRSLTSWIPSMPSLPSMPSMPSMSMIPGLGGQTKAKQSTAAAKKTSTTTKSNQTQQPKASGKSQAPSKPQVSPKPQAPSKSQSKSPKASTQTSTSKPPQQANETEVKKRPKKLEARSTSNISQTDQNTTVRKAPPKLGPRRNPTAAKAS